MHHFWNSVFQLIVLDTCIHDRNKKKQKIPGNLLLRKYSMWYGVFYFYVLGDNLPWSVTPSCEARTYSHGIGTAMHNIEYALPAPAAVCDAQYGQRGHVCVLIYF